jgi:hypothetical protein
MVSIWFSELAHGLRLAFELATALGVQKIVSVGLKECQARRLCLDDEETILWLALTGASTLGVCICICIGERDETLVGSTL